jgi:hypothetical protein
MLERRERRAAKHRNLLKKVIASRHALYPVRRPIKQLPNQ